MRIALRENRNVKLGNLQNEFTSEKREKQVRKKMEKENMREGAKRQKMKRKRI